MQIDNSPNISSLDFKVVIDTINGNFIVNLQPSIFTAGGEFNVKGAKLKIKSPYGGVLIKDYTANFDVEPPENSGSGSGDVADMFSDITVQIPKVLQSYQYGLYKARVQLTDYNDVTFETGWKDINFSQVVKNDKFKTCAKLNIDIQGACNEGKMIAIADGIPPYNGKLPNSQIYNLKLEYPFGALPEETITVPKFSARLFEGDYRISGDVQVEYNLGDNVYAIIRYDVSSQKNIRCIPNVKCISDGVMSLTEQLESDCTERERQETQNAILRVLILLQSINSGVASGNDVSKYIQEVEWMFDCDCGCGTPDGTPINVSEPVSDIIIEGCGFETSTNGLTTTYHINNYSWEITANDPDGIITVSDPVIDGCKVSVSINYSAAKAYRAIKRQINNQNEYNFWGQVIQNSQSFNETGTIPKCDAKLSSVNVTQSNDNINIEWDSDKTYEVTVYIDGVLVGSVLSEKDNIDLSGFADGKNHIYALIPRCDTGAVGYKAEGSFTYSGCATVALPNLVSNIVPDAICPYNLDDLISTVPSGVTIEWHTKNNTDAGSLIDNPTSVGSGTYYAFAVDADGCYSDSFKINIVCSESTASCSAPQNMIIDRISSGVRVQFGSAAYPPPNNQYMVIRRKQSDPDIAGSYTAIGQASWNSSSNKWQVIDTTAPTFDVYVYRAYSNCGNNPYVDKIYGNIPCVTPTIVPSKNSITVTYSSDYDSKITLYAGNFVSEVASESFIGGDVVTHTFNNLNTDYPYKIGIVSELNGLKNTCPLIPTRTLQEAPVINITGNVLHDSGNIIVESLSSTIPCDLYVSVNVGATPQNTLVVVKIPGGASTGTQSLPPGYSFDHFIDSNVVTYAECNGQQYRILLSVSGGGSMETIEFGFTNLVTTQGTPSEQDYIDSVDDPSTNRFTMSAEGPELVVPSFFNNSNKVLFISTPGIMNFDLWDEVGNPIQQDMPIDQTIGAGSNVWFKTNNPNGGVYYFTRYQTSFVNPVKFKHS